MWRLIHRFGIRVLILLVLPLGLAIFRVMKSDAQSSSSVSIRQTGFDGLRKGSFGDAGANLYVSVKGRIQTIHRWDLNNDGELDLFFTQDHNHDYAPDMMIYWGSADGYESLLPELPQLRTSYSLYKHAMQASQRITWLPALGGGRCQIADLNGDGYLDIIFGNSMHNYRQDMPAYVYWGSAQGFKTSNQTVLPAYIVTGVAVGDLNGDGLPDIVLASTGFEKGFDLRFGQMTHNLESYIYWGDINGFDVSRRASIPTVCAADVAIGDFNGDHHPDLAFVNNDVKERSIYVYWGDGTGNFKELARQVLPVAETRPTATSRDIEMKTLLASDLNGDGFCDLAVAGNFNAIIFNGSARGLKVERGANLPATNCLGLAAADLNNDGHIDLVLANAGADFKDPPASTIYWGSTQGYSAERRTDLPTLGAWTVKAADLNHDGFADLLFGNQSRNKDVPSQIFFGGPNGFAGYRRKDLQGFGVIGAGVADLNQDGNPDIVLINHLNGFAPIPAAIYWGNKEHYYSSGDVTLLSPGGAYMYSIADLDDDNFPDILMMMRDGRLFVWWGSQSGYCIDNRTEVLIKSPSAPKGGNVGAFNVADLDRDGHLDIVCMLKGDVKISPGALSGVEHQMARAVIIYGNEKRFNEARTSSEFQLSGWTGAQSIVIADLNKDGQLDLIFPMSDIDHSEIWWGGASGYDPGNVTILEANSSPHAVVADLDRDGWLDVVFTSGSGNIKNGQAVVGGDGILGKTHNSETYIYWGSPEGFKSRTAVESFTALEATVADFNRDGHLDIALTNYKSDTTREIPAIIYWGDGTRGYSNQRRTFLDASSSSAIVTLDLNRDGWPDLVVSNHQKNFSHLSGTNIYWGSEKGFSLSNRTTIPTVGVHLNAMVDAGNIYDRKYEWDYASTPIEAPKDTVFARLRWKAETELGTGVKFQVRTAATREELAKVKWAGPKDADSFYLESGAQLVGVKREDRWLQYRAVLFSPDGGNSPFLGEVEIVNAKNGEPAKTAGQPRRP